MSLQRQINRQLAKAIREQDFLKLASLGPKIAKLLEKPHNLILLSDAYKYSHHRFYPEGITKVHSYLESRGGLFDNTVFTGLQLFLKKYLSGVALITEEVDEAEKILNSPDGVFGRSDVFDRTKFDYIIEKHGGKLPIKIKAVPEGTPVTVSNVLLCIENTDDNCAWLTNFLESIILQVWYPTTVATLSREVKKIVRGYWDKCTNYDESTKDFLIGFVLNDFGFRGVSSVESAMHGGIGHLINFDGSDNTIASKGIIDFYNTDKVYGKSVPATEHSIMSILGPKGEIDMMRRTLNTFPDGIVACVSDTFDIKDAILNKYGKELKDLILSRPNTPGNQLVIRPDSGHILKTLEMIFNGLFDSFGYTTNEKGYKVLPPQVRVIQGDGVNINSIAEILEWMDSEKISPENLVFGMGGKLLQADINRDTQKFATKASYAVINGEEFTVVKSPTEIDENGNQQPSFKKSKQGLMKLVKNDDDTYRTVTSLDADFDDVKDELVVVFENGVIVREYSFDEVRENAKLETVLSEELS